MRESRERLRQQRKKKKKMDLRNPKTDLVRNPELLKQKGIKKSPLSQES
jgi:hypothetical protein